MTDALVVGTEERSDVLCLPCLGRPFRLGTAYDFCRDAIVPGLRPWSNETISRAEKQLEDPPNQISFSYELITDNGLSDKMSHLEVGANLGLSVISGLADLSGAAGYGRDHRQSRKSCLFTLKYRCTSRFVSLSTDCLVSLENDGILDDPSVTHIATGLLYGADVYFVFDHVVQEDEDYINILGEMEMAVKSFPKIDLGVGMGAGVETENEQTDFKANIHCRVYGDIRFDTNPTTFNEAVDLYKRLPTYLGKNLEKTVPKKVWLYSLDKLAKLNGKDHKPKKAQETQKLREIHAHYVEVGMQTVQELDCVTERSDEILLQMSNKEYSGMFQSLSKLVTKFKSNVIKYKQGFTEFLKKNIPRVRSGDLLTTVPKEYVDLHSSKSPFAIAHLNSWLDEREKELVVLEEMIQCFKSSEKNVEFAFHLGKMDEILFSFEYDHILSFEFTFLKYKDSYVEEVMLAYLDEKKIVEFSTGNGWCNDVGMVKKVLVEAKQFKELVESTSTNVAFVVAESTKKADKKMGAVIRLYTNTKSIKNIDRIRLALVNNTTDEQEEEEESGNEDTGSMNEQELKRSQKKNREKSDACLIL